MSLLPELFDTVIDQHGMLGDAMTNRKVVPSLPPSQLTKSLDWYRTKQAPAAPVSNNLPKTNIGKPADPKKQGEFKDSAGRRYCLRDGQRVPCAPGQEEPATDDGANQEQKPPELTPKQTQLAPQGVGAKPTTYQPEGGDTEKDFSDPKFAEEWDKIVADEIDAIEKNTVTDHQFNPEQAKAEQGWQQQVIDWFKGGGKPGAKDVGTMARFMSGLLNPIVTPAKALYDMARVVAAVGTLDAKWINALADEFDGNQQAATVAAATLGPQAVPVAKQMGKGWKDKAKIQHGNGKYGDWKLPKAAMRDTGDIKETVDPQTGKKKREKVQEHNTDAYKDHWLNQFKAKARKAGVRINEKVLDQALNAVDEHTGKTHEDDEAHGKVIQELEKIIDEHAPPEVLKPNDPALAKAAAAGQLTAPNSPATPPALPNSQVPGAAPANGPTGTTPGTPLPKPLTKDEMAKILAQGPLTDEVLARMTPADRSVAVAAEREARQRPNTQLRQAAGPVSKPGKVAVHGARTRAQMAARAGRAAGVRRRNETPEQTTQREAKEAVDRAARKQRQEARAAKQQAAHQKRVEQAAKP